MEPVLVKTPTFDDEGQENASERPEERRMFGG
jgi:hypothetical protein